MRAANEKLTQASHKLAEALYKASSTQAAGRGAGCSDGAGRRNAGAEQKKDEGEVIDAEYVDVDDKK